jgi:hypothetical protein
MNDAMLGVRLAAGIAVAVVRCSSAPAPIQTTTSPATPAPAPAAPTPTPAACVVPQNRPPPVLPWDSVEALCAAPHGTAWRPPNFGDPPPVSG